MAVVPTNERAAARSGALTVLRRGNDGVGDRRHVNGAHYSPNAVAAPLLGLGPDVQVPIDVLAW